MQNQTFDQRMRQKAQGERWGASAQAQGRLEKAMRKGVQQQKPAAASNGWPRAIAWAAAAAAVVLMIIMIHPPADLTDGSAVLSAVGLGPRRYRLPCRRERWISLWKTACSKPRPLFPTIPAISG